MNNTLRQEVLKCFKALHKTRMIVFNGDSFALNDSRLKINQEFRKNMHVNDSSAIQELVKYGNAVEHELKTSVIQAKEISPGIYEAKITEHTVTLENVPYSDCPNVDIKKSKKSTKKCR